MGNKQPAKANPPPRNPVPQGKTRICVAGFTTSPHVGRARKIAGLIAQTHPDKYETWFYFDGSDQYYDFLKLFDNVPFPDHLKGHSTAPFCWLETSPNEIKPLGGRDHLSQWALQTFPGEQAIVEMASDWSLFKDTFHNKDDAYKSTADISTK